MNMRCALSVSGIRLMRYPLEAHCIGMLCMEPTLRGIGIFTMMVFMLMYFLHIVIRYGGIGVGIGVFPVLIGV